MWILKREPLFADSKPDEGLFYRIYSDSGTKLPRGFTPETDATQVDRFLELLNEDV